MRVLPSRIFIAVKGKKIETLPGKLLAGKNFCPDEAGGRKPKITIKRTELECSPVINGEQKEEGGALYQPRRLLLPPPHFRDAKPLFGLSLLR